MDFFRAQQAVGVKTPTYFIESTAPYNVDDTESDDRAAMPPEAAELAKYLKKIDPKQAIKDIAAALLQGNDPQPGGDGPRLQQSGAGRAEDVHFGSARDRRRSEINSREGLVCVGYRWPSEKMGMPWRGTWDALPTLPTWLMYFGILVVLLTFPLFYFAAETRQWWIDLFRYIWNPSGVHVITLLAGPWPDLC